MDNNGGAFSDDLFEDMNGHQQQQQQPHNTEFLSVHQSFGLNNNSNNNNNTRFKNNPSINNSNNNNNNHYDDNFNESSVMIYNFDHNDEEDRENHQSIEVESLTDTTKQKGVKIVLFIGVITLFMILTSIGLYTFAKARENKPIVDVGAYPTIVISLDGFRWDYLQRGVSPHLNYIKDNGFGANFTTPQFPSKTFPNHYSLATGLRPEYHGIVGNHMYDPVSKKKFSDKDPSWYQWAEPIWVTAGKQNLTTACYFWFGCSVPIKGYQPNYNYDTFTFTNVSKILGTVASWRGLSIETVNQTSPALTMAYIYEVDDNGHKFGPDSQQVNDAIAMVDNAIGDLITTLKRQGTWEKTNMIVVSDHGMTALSKQRVVNLDDYFDTSKIIIGDTSPVCFIFPIEGKITKEEVYESIHGKHPNMTVYYKEDIPAHFNLNNPNNPRISPIIAITDLGWSIVTNSTIDWLENGNHGFNPDYQDMKSIFLAHGPNIKSTQENAKDSKNQPLPTTFQNIELYNLLISLLNINPENAAPNNGTSFLTDTIFKNLK
ncbi:hypothetical protein CYY_009000 [Polysphondylium violaceum]|uniref:Type I phosphodiesterase/nucleotide pyrophosphatase family protein n=1 Tax=Polysphondylium violaceum TaxID=133409 RepID=A0A8J4PMB8_9MYCE|nr:hypothetical protein CYY_009000 [Polysphondylium violaceum]